MCKAVVFFFFSLFLSATDVAILTEPRAYPILKVAVTRAGFRVVEQSPVVLDVQFDLKHHLYDGVRDEFTVKVQIFNEGRSVYASKRDFDLLRYSTAPLWNRDTAPKVGAAYLGQIFKHVNLDELLGTRVFGQVVAVRGRIVVVDTVLPMGMKLALFSEDLPNLGRAGQIIQREDFLVAEGVVFNNGEKTSEILLSEVFGEVRETLRVRIQGR